MLMSRKVIVACGLAAVTLGGLIALQYWQREHRPLDHRMIQAEWKPLGQGHTIRARNALSASTQNWENGEIYLLLFDVCDRRVEIARAMAAYLQRRHGNGYVMNVRDEAVSPGPETIQTCGKYWTDCPHELT